MNILRYVKKICVSKNLFFAIVDNHYNIDTSFSRKPRRKERKKFATDKLRVTLSVILTCVLMFIEAHVGRA